MVAMMRRRGRRRAAQRPPDLGAAAREYAAMGWPVCPGLMGKRRTRRDRAVGPGSRLLVRPGALSGTGRAPGLADLADAGDRGQRVVGQWWEARPEANVILATGRVFDVLDVPAVAGATALARMAAAGVETGPVAVQGTERMLFFVLTRGAPADEDEWWSCGLDSSPDPSTQTEALRWHCRDSYVLAPPSRYGTGQDVRWVREPARAATAGRAAAARVPG